RRSCRRCYPRRRSPHSLRVAAAKRPHVRSESAREPTGARAVDLERKQRPRELSVRAIAVRRAGSLICPPGRAQFTAAYPELREWLYSFGGERGIRKSASC